VVTANTKTLAKATPSLIIDNLIVEKTSIDYSEIVQDLDKTGYFQSVEVLQSNNLVIEILDKEISVITGLVKGTAYTIKFNYRYNLNEGTPFQNIITDKKVVTTLFSGQGTIDKPFEIYTLEEFNNLRVNLDASYILMNDIDLAGNEWTPIGTNIAPFTGILEGQGFTISNLKITKHFQNIGLFGVSHGNISNLNLNGVDIRLNNFFTESNIGSLSGTNSGDIFDINITQGTIIVNNIFDFPSYIGGVIGRQNDSGIYQNIYNNIDLSVNSNSSQSSSVGGIVGYAFNDNKIILELINLTNEGVITGGTISSGIIGLARNTDLILTNNINRGNVVSASYLASGLVGYTYTIDFGLSQNITINDSYNYGNVYSDDISSGLLGGTAYINSVSVNNSKNYGTVGNSNLNVESHERRNISGGLIGQVTVTKLVSIKDSYNNGDIFGIGQFSGGIIGYVGEISQKLIISDSKNNATITGHISGGIIGSSEKANSIDFLNIENSGNILGSKYAGGVFGELQSYNGRNGIVYNLKNIENNGDITSNLDSGGLAGNVVGSNDSQLIVSIFKNTGVIIGLRSSGGAIGYSEGNNGALSMDLSLFSNFGSVTSNKYSGGMIGYYDTSLYSGYLKITYSINYANISSLDYSGGLIGYSKSTYSSVTISEAINLGSINGTNYSGGIIGFNNNLILSDKIISLGEVFGSKYVGGFFGYSNLLAISNSLSNVNFTLYDNAEVETIINYYVFINDENNFYNILINDENQNYTLNNFGSFTNTINLNDVNFYYETLGFDINVWLISVNSQNNDMVIQFK
jgi:hypothetical protein